jgi:hypothetical protein
LLDRRASLIFAAAAPVGLVLGAAAWTLAGGAGFAEASIASAAGQFPTLRTRGAVGSASSSGAARAIGAPLFALLGGRGAVADPAIRLEGIARSPGRVAALLAIDAKPSAWLGLGETRDGVTLVEVLGSKITVDTVIGVKEVRLGEATTSATGAAGSPILAIGQDTPPPGYRMPPAPASAPAMSASSQ